MAVCTWDRAHFVLLSYYCSSTHTSQAMLERAAHHGVAPVNWQAGYLPTGEAADVCIASGKCAWAYLSFCASS